MTSNRLPKRSKRLWRLRRLDSRPKRVRSHAYVYAEKGSKQYNEGNLPARCVLECRRRCRFAKSHNIHHTALCVVLCRPLLCLVAELQRLILLGASHVPLTLKPSSCAGGRRQWRRAARRRRTDPQWRACWLALEARAWSTARGRARGRAANPRCWCVTGP